MTSSHFDKHTALYKSPDDWLVRLAIDLAALCMTCGAENGTNLIPIDRF